MKYLMLLMSILLLSGCNLLAPQATSTMNTFTVAPNLAIPVARNLHRSILITTPEAIPELKTEKMAYFQQNWLIQYYTKNRWIAPPAQMLLPIMVDTLNRTHHYRAVVSSPFTGVTEYRLDSQLIRFQRVFYASSTAESEFLITLRAQLVNASSERIIASREISIGVPVNSISPYAGVHAANQAIAQLMQQLAQFCVTNT
ncbi:MAG: membrane integrity-associated transporter subunit PqiC [Legionellales bacterium]|nr:membrane integrity-associated transporter subunit PqiC [Legionellales bacterium]